MLRTCQGSPTNIFYLTIDLTFSLVVDPESGCPSTSIYLGRGPHSVLYRVLKPTLQVLTELQIARIKYQAAVPIRKCLSQLPPSQAVANQSPASHLVLTSHSALKISSAIPRSPPPTRCGADLRPRGSPRRSALRPLHEALDVSSTYLAFRVSPRYIRPGHSRTC